MLWKSHKFHLKHPNLYLIASFLVLNLACRTAANFFLPPTPTGISTLALPSATVGLPSTTETPLPTYTQIPTPTLDTVPAQQAEPLACEGLLAFHLLQPAEQTRDLFEHHAQGTFLIFHLEAINLTSGVIQIYSHDYTLILPREDDEIRLKPHKAATNYLYLVRGDNFYQDKIEPFSIWRTYLAFDVPLETSSWKLLLTPGSGNSLPLCQTTITP
ncbi:MAG: hypothetical protein Kow0088_27130 [Anaerolineales bacterium]